MAQITKEQVINQIMNMAVSAGGVPESYRVYYYENYGKNYFGANLEQANIVARNFADAFLQARSYILANARNSHGEPIDIYDHDEIDGPIVDINIFIANYLSNFANNDTLWMQKANEPCNMEWN